MAQIVAIFLLLLVSVSTRGDEKPVADLPHLFVTEAGDRVASLREWRDRRHEIAEILQYYQYGHLPPRPERIEVIDQRRRDMSDIGAVEIRMTLLIGAKARLPLRMALYLPSATAGTGPFPILIREEHALGHLEELPSIIDRGYGFVEYAREDLDPDKAALEGPAQKAYPEYDWATLAVWAWGAMRVVDYLETRDDVRLDQLGIIGHSRGGKMALLAGALDERFALVVANGSGAGGAGSYLLEGKDSETLELITRPDRFGYWFHPRLRWYVSRRAQLPFDQHFLKALVAPRALLCTEALGDLWANPQGTKMTSRAADAVFKWYGVIGKNALHFREGQHDLTDADWTAILDYADWHLRGVRPAATDIYRRW